MVSKSALLFLAAAGAAATVNARPASGFDDNPEAIVGGENVASADTYPWLVSLRGKQGFWVFGSTSHFCGASLIAKNLILTAAHCVDAFSSFGEVTASAHRYDQQATTAAEKGIDFTVKQRFLNPNWKRNVANGGDIALLVVEPKSPADNSTTIPYLEVGKTTAKPAAKDVVTIAGWGLLKDRRDGGKPARFLQEVDVPVLSIPDCQSYYKEGGDEVTKAINEKLICVGEPPAKSACQGDSGGPLFGIENGKPVLYGVTSFGGKCGATPTLYTRIASYSDWLTPLVEKYGQF
ncbi:Chymotrypsin-like elastase member 1 [Quaeritorhiza haematococci]|nr:Chymotrypsin-like elastase member 1 [Quaeritorhiza haematococci]